MSASTTQLVARSAIARDVDQMAAEERLEEIALFRALPDDVGLAFLGMDVDIGAGDVDVAAQDQLAAFVVQLFRPAGKRRQERELRGIVLAAVGHVHGGEHEIPERDLHDAGLHVELGMAELGYLEQLATKVQRYARITSAATVPECMVIVELALVRHLIGARLDFLQADDVGTIAREPVAELRGAGADSIDVPGGNLHKICTILIISN